MFRVIFLFFCLLLLQGVHFLTVIENFAAPAYGMVKEMSVI